MSDGSEWSPFALLAACPISGHAGQPERKRYKTAAAFEKIRRVLFSDWRRDMGRNAPKTFVIVISMPSYDPHGFIETFAFFIWMPRLFLSSTWGEHCALRGSLSDSACPCSMAGKVCHIICGHIRWKGINANGTQQSWISTMPTSRFPKIASFRSFRLQRLTVSVRIWYS